MRGSFRERCSSSMPVGFDKRLVGADLVVTARAASMAKSVYGKLTHAVTVAAKRRGVPVVGRRGNDRRGARGDA